MLKVNNKYNIFGIVVASFVAIIVLLSMVTINIIRYKPVGNASLNVISEHQMANNSISYNINFADVTINTPYLYSSTNSVSGSKYYYNGSGTGIVGFLYGNYNKTFDIGAKALDYTIDNSFGVTGYLNETQVFNYSFNATNNYKINVDKNINRLNFWFTYSGNYDLTILNSVVNNKLYNAYNQGRLENTNSIVVDYVAHVNDLEEGLSPGAASGSVVISDNGHYNIETLTYGSYQDFFNAGIWCMVAFKFSQPLSWDTTFVFNGYSDYGRLPIGFIGDKGQELTGLNPSSNKSINGAINLKDLGSDIGNINYILIGTTEDSIIKEFYVDYTNESYYVGFNSGVDSVVNNPNYYNLYTYGEYLNYGDVKYNEGLASGSDISIENTIDAVVSSPIKMIKEMFNFELFGINIASLVMFVLSLGIIFLILSIFKGRS